MQGSRSIPVSIQGGAFIVLAVALLVLPLRWLAAFVFAAAVHETGHFAAVRLCGCPVYGIRIGINGAVMETGPLGTKQECLCALAGPVSGILLLLAARLFPKVALCALAQSAFNLLPIYPLDGGRAVKCIACILFPNSPQARRFLQWLLPLGTVCFGAYIFARVLR